MRHRPSLFSLLALNLRGSVRFTGPRSNGEHIVAVDSRISHAGIRPLESGYRDGFPTPQGTADYRRAAIVARFAPNPTDNGLRRPVGNRRLGDSPTMQFEEDLKIDMAFYEHRFGDRTSIRVGKAALPIGIYNEARYVGALLPFYRAPFAMYGEGSFTSETINGLLLSHRVQDRPAVGAFYRSVRG